MAAPLILVVDDDPDIRRIASLSLDRIGGFRVSVASGGREAVEMAVRDPPDLILLDVTMPGMDGPETLVSLRALSATAAVPVVFFTATAGAEEVARLCAMGALGVVEKPFDVGDLPGRIRALLRPDDVQ